jgi:hypothetical protein
MPLCKGTNRSRKKGQPCQHEAIKGYDFCRVHMPPTPEQIVDNSIALEIADQFEEELKKRVPHHKAHDWADRMRGRIEQGSDRSLVDMLIDTARLSETQRSDRIKGWAALLQEDWDILIAQIRDISDTTAENSVISARDYFLHRSPEFEILMAAMADGRTGTAWSTNSQTGTRTYIRPDLPSHYVQLALTQQEREDSVAIDAFYRLSFAQDADAAFAMLYVCRLLAPPAPMPQNMAPVGWIEIDDVMQKIGWVPRSTEERQKFRARIWDYLCFGERAGVYGRRPSIYRNKVTGELIPTEVDGPIWSFHGRERPARSSLLQVDEVPVRVEIVMSRTWTRLITDSSNVQYLPLGEKLGSICSNRPPGAWARCIGLALVNLWGSEPRLTLSRAIKPTRRALLTRYTPKIAPPLEILAGNTPRRAREYWRQALDILVEMKFLARPANPYGDVESSSEESELPRIGWQDAWLDGRVLLLPGAAMLSAIEDAANALLPPIPVPATVLKRGPGRPRKS